MNGFMRAEIWIHDAQGVFQEHPFAGFAMLFFAYNAIYSEYWQGRERPKDDYDRILAREWLNDVQVDRNELAKFLDSDGVAYFRNRKPKGFDVPILDSRYGKPSKWAYHHELIRENLGDTDISLEHLKALVDVLYQIRCNLFHGGKENIGEDREIISMAFDVLRFVLLEYMRQLYNEEHN